MRPEGLRAYCWAPPWPMRSEGRGRRWRLGEPRSARWAAGDAGRGQGDAGRGTRDAGRAAAHGAGPAGPGGCGAPGRGASPARECEAQPLRVLPARLKLLWLTGGCSFPRVRFALFCGIKDFSFSEVEP